MDALKMSRKNTTANYRALLNSAECAVLPSHVRARKRSSTEKNGLKIENVELENQEGGSHELSIDAATYAGGVYLVNIYTNGAVSTERFVKK